MSGLVKITHRSPVPGNKSENEMRRSCGKETEEEREGKGAEEEVKKDSLGDVRKHSLH